MTKESAIRIFVVLTALVMAPHCLAQERNLVRVKGDSDSISMIEQLSQSFMRLRPDTNIVFSIGNSKDALHLLESGDTEVAVVEDEISQKEIEKASTKGRKLVTRKIGFMDIMMIVNRSNPVDELTLKQIADMYAGRITNWKDLGGADIPITCYLPSLPNSSTVDWWKSTFLAGKSLSDGTAIGLSWNGIAYLVASPKSGKPGAIAFIRSCDLDRLALKGDAGMLKVLRIRKDPQAIAVLPSLDVHGRTNYPILRPLYAYYDANSKSRLPEEFIHFLAGAAGAL
jgi:phosphate transport system substrate-binding protein